MKYRQLTTEQLEALHEEFSKFLATQQVDAKEWDTMKKENKQMAIDEVNLFSDIVWEDVLNKADYIDHISDKHLNLFKCTSKEMIRIHVKIENEHASFLSKSDFEEFLSDPLHANYQYFKASKKYSSDRNLELFKLIEMGAQISDGQLFKQIAQLIA